MTNYSINSQSTATRISDVIRSKTNLMAWAIFVTGILYYCYAYLLRVYPGIMENDLLMHFHITAGTFGNLAAFYYYAYAPMQLPVGLTVDRFGARRTLILACFISVIGLTIFAYSSYLPLAEFGRFLIGFGSAFAYVTVLKLATLWLPKNYFATATGVATGSGMLSAVFTEIYLTRLVQTFGYAVALCFCILIGIVLLFLIISLIRDKSPSHNTTYNHNSGESVFSFNQLGHYIWLLAKNPQMWLIGIIGAMMYLPASVFLDVWGPAYLKAVYHLTPKQAGLGVSMTLCGWIFASPIVGMLSDKFGTRKIPLIFSTFSASLVAAIIFYIPNISTILLYMLLFILGLLCASHPLCFTLSKENNSSKIAGTSIAFANCLIMSGGVVFQPVVGKLLDYGWTGTFIHGIRSYTIGDYTFALSIIPLGLFCAGLLTLVLKETFQKQV